ncbi:MAG: hypothetical protein KatS3mg027_2321 [Bacteroidia bacterium]|nr:MAG: hypothetical protein KatS3mg027_2321 [Bacteroidia bacterium]
MKQVNYIIFFFIFLMKVSLCSAQIRYLEAFKYQGKTKAEIQKERYIAREERKEAREKRKIERMEKKRIKKHHKQLQDKKTYKRMKKTLKKAKMYNENKREFFLIRWFKYKRKVR